MKTIWKPIKIDDVKENMYEISNKGEIRNINTGKKLKPTNNKKTNYLYVSLMKTNGKSKKYLVHRLVAIHFIDIPARLISLNEKLEVNHDDFNRHNNRSDNLSWVTSKMNNEWNFIHDHWKICDNAPNSKVLNEEVHKICKLMEDGYLNKEIIEILGYENSTYIKSLMTRIRTGKQWKYISSQYKIKNKNTLRKNNEEFINDICKLLEKGYSVKEMRVKLNIPDEDKTKFKKLVWFIRKRKIYKDISKNYIW